MVLLSSPWIEPVLDVPWAVAVTRIGITPETAWTYHFIIFGVSLVFSFFVVTCVLPVAALRLHKGAIKLQVVLSST